MICFFRLLFTIQPAARINQLVFTECVLETLCSNMSDEALVVEFHERKLCYDSPTSMVSANMCLYLGVISL